eukprot:6210028-Pleurochrysis_carterae.AAC.7
MGGVFASSCTVILSRLTQFLIERPTKERWPFLSPAHANNFSFSTDDPSGLRPVELQSLRSCL